MEVAASFRQYMICSGRPQQFCDGQQYCLKPGQIHTDDLDQTLDG